MAGGAGRTRRTGDLGFRLGTGAFALVLVLIVCAIGFELTRQSMLSIEKFGLNFWRTEVWDPVAGQFGALPFIWGTLYSSILALALATPIALGIAVFISELCPNVLRQPLVFLTELLAAIPSIVYGLWGIFVLVPFVRALESGMPQALRSLPIFSGPPLGVGMLAAGLILAVMVIPFTSSGRARCSSRCQAHSAKARMRSARRGSKPSARRCSMRARVSWAP
jgi:phosphate transport system permease protein